MTNKSTMLLEHNLKQLKLPTFLRDILEMNGDSYRLKHSKKTSGRQLSD